MKRKRKIWSASTLWNLIRFVFKQSLINTILLHESMTVLQTRDAQQYIVVPIECIRFREKVKFLKKKWKLFHKFYNSHFARGKWWKLSHSKSWSTLHVSCMVVENFFFCLCVSFHNFFIFFSIFNFFHLRKSYTL